MFFRTLLFTDINFTDFIFTDIIIHAKASSVQVMSVIIMSDNVQEILSVRSEDLKTSSEAYKWQNSSAIGRFIVTNPPIGKPRYNADLAITRFFASKFFLPRPAL